MSNRALSILLSLAASAALFACATSSNSPAHDAEDPSLAPRPFTAEQIRENHPAGTVLVFKLEQPGMPPIMRTMRFVTSDAEGASLEESVVLDGEPMGEVKTTNVTWKELRDHASFAADKTRVSRAKCTIGARTFDCSLYEVEGEEDGVASKERYYFVLERPGPPVVVEREVDGETVIRMELVESTQPHGA